MMVDMISLFLWHTSVESFDKKKVCQGIFVLYLESWFPAIGHLLAFTAGNRPSSTAKGVHIQGTSLWPLA